MTYKPNAHYMNIIMPLARQFGMTPQRVVEMMINEYVKDDSRYESLQEYKLEVTIK